MSGAVDHCTMWPIDFYPDNIPLEACWDCMEILKVSAIEDDDPLPMVAESAEPQLGYWPEVASSIPAFGMFAYAGNGNAMRESFLKQALVRILPGLDEPAVSELAK